MIPRYESLPGPCKESKKIMCASMYVYMCVTEGEAGIMGSMKAEREGRGGGLKDKVRKKGEKGGGEGGRDGKISI